MQASKKSCAYERTYYRNPKLNFKIWFTLNSVLQRQVWELHIVDFNKEQNQYMATSMNNLFRGIPFSQEDNAWAWMYVSVIIAWEENWEIFFCRFPSFLQVFERFCSKSLILMGRNGQLKPGKLLNIIGHIGNKKKIFNIIVLILREQHLFKCQAFSLTQPVDLALILCWLNLTGFSNNRALMSQMDHWVTTIF